MKEEEEGGSETTEGKVVEKEVEKDQILNEEEEDVYKWRRFIIFTSTDMNIYLKICMKLSHISVARSNSRIPSDRPPEGRQ